MADRACGGRRRIGWPWLLVMVWGTRVAVADAKDTPSATGFAWKPVTDASLGLREDGKPVFAYNHGVIRREGVDAHFFRSSYVHPLHGLDGEVLSDDFPKDHPHHRGVFWGWPHVRVGDVEHDNWALKPGLRFQFEKWTRREAGRDRAILGLENGWFTGDEKVVREQVEITVHRARANHRSIDFDLIWTALKRPVTLQGAANKSYGGFNLRFAPRLGKSVITVPKGRTKEDLTVTKLTWADLTSTFKGAPGASGAAIFIHPSHPDYPPTWLTRHYGVLCVGWPGVAPGTLQPGKPVRCRYRVWVHRGAVEPAELQRAYEAYVGKKTAAGQRQETTTSMTTTNNSRKRDVVSASPGV